MNLQKFSLITFFLIFSLFNTNLYSSAKATQALAELALTEKKHPFSFTFLCTENQGLTVSDASYCDTFELVKVKHENRFNDPLAELIDLTHLGTSPEMITLLHTFATLDPKFIDFTDDSDDEGTLPYQLYSQGGHFLTFIDTYSIPKLLSLLATIDFLCFNDSKKNALVQESVQKKILYLCADKTFKKRFIAGEPETTKAIDLLEKRSYFDTIFFREMVIEDGACTPIDHHHEIYFELTLHPLDALPEISTVNPEQKDWFFSWEREKDPMHCTLEIEDYEGQKIRYSLPYPGNGYFSGIVKSFLHQQKFIAVHYLNGYYCILQWDLSHPTETPLVFRVIGYNFGLHFSRDFTYGAFYSKESSYHYIYLFNLRNGSKLYSVSGIDQSSTIKDLSVYPDHTNNELNLFITEETKDGEIRYFVAKGPTVETEKDQYFLYCLNTLNRSLDEGHSVPIDPRYGSYFEQCKKCFTKKQLAKFYI